MNTVLKAALIILAIAVAAAAAVFLIPRESTAPESGTLPPPEEEEEAVADPARVPPEDEEGNALPPPEGMRELPPSIVRITDQGFEPAVFTIEVGGIVTWVNESSRASRPASDVHPTHGEYPEGSGCVGSALDACRELQPGDEYKFEFSHAGEWGIHDHLMPTVTGTIIVTE